MLIANKFRIIMRLLSADDTFLTVSNKQISVKVTARRR